jgi:parallel beta-helix repeat protein
VNGLALLLAVWAAHAGGQNVIRVPQDQPTVAAGVAAAAPGDLVLLDRGTYPGDVTVPASKPGITIRGVDRNAVVFDGRGVQKDAVVIRADGVAVQNMSAHDFLDNGFYWSDVKGFTGSYLTVWDVRGYGIYAEESTDGSIDHDYVSGAGDAAYYIGECRPCRATLSNDTARLSAVGYSGSNASGSLVIRDSVWDGNGTAILPNSLANEADPPQSDMTITGNRILGSGRARVPLLSPIGGLYGLGIAIAGGNRNRITRNTITGSRRYGIAVFSTAHRIPTGPGPHPAEPPWRPAANVVSRNTVRGSGVADLALSSTTRSGNCFRANTVSTSQPRRLQRRSCRRAGGDAVVTTRLERSFSAMLATAAKIIHPIPYTAVPAPPSQPNQPGTGRR